MDPREGCWATLPHCTPSWPIPQVQGFLMGVSFSGSLQTALSAAASAERSRVLLCADAPGCDYPSLVLPVACSVVRVRKHEFERKSSGAISVECFGFLRWFGPAPGQVCPAEGGKDMLSTPCCWLQLALGCPEEADAKSVWNLSASCWAAQRCNCLCYNYQNICGPVKLAPSCRNPCRAQTAVCCTEHMNRLLMEQLWQVDPVPLCGLVPWVWLLPERLLETVLIAQSVCPSQRPEHELESKPSSE